MTGPHVAAAAGAAWMARARCRGGDPAWWFPEGRVSDDDPVWDWPRAWCAGCTVLADCRTWIDAAERGQPKAYLHGTGMWAGETPLQRMARRKKEGTR